MLVLFVWRENGHINVQILGILDFLLVSMSSLYLCCCLMLSLSSRWCKGAMCAIQCFSLANEFILQVFVVKFV